MLGAVFSSGVWRRRDEGRALARGCLHDPCRTRPLLLLCRRFSAMRCGHTQCA